MPHGLRWPSTETGWRRAVLGIVAFAVLLRFGLVAALGAPPALWEYHDIATNILAGRGWVLDRVGIEYRSFYAGWPYVGATIVAYVGFPSGAAGMQAFQALFSGAGVLGVVLVGRRVFDSRVALLAALLAATHPALVYYDVKNLHPLGFDSAMLTGAVALVLAVGARVRGAMGRAPFWYRHRRLNPPAREPRTLDADATGPRLAVALGARGEAWCTGCRHARRNRPHGPAGVRAKFLVRP